MATADAVEGARHSPPRHWKLAQRKTRLQAPVPDVSRASSRAQSEFHIGQWHGFSNTPDGCGTQGHGSRRPSQVSGRGDGSAGQFHVSSYELPTQVAIAPETHVDHHSSGDQDRRLGQDYTNRKCLLDDPSLLFSFLPPFVPSASQPCTLLFRSFFFHLCQVQSDSSSSSPADIITTPSKSLVHFDSTP